ncbi:NAD(P)/FAD-dependent oxidoreductase [Pontiella sp.]|uniref:NAD(P)/FAD-dependent oxidoreductase n=1 Tax=Pontiella sp. TaxID=2837462 RepID=UPI003566A0B7
MTNGVKHIAVIGSGAAGLTAAHILQRQHRVTLFEKRERLGGHTNTVLIPDGPDAGTPVDTGFIVMNHRNYPLLTRLLDQLGVELRDSDMTFGYYDLPSGLQYCGTGLDGLFAQRKNILSPAFHRMLRDMIRFFKTAEADWNNEALADETFVDYLRRNDFGLEFITHHIIPMGSAIWSTPCDDMLEFPAQSFLQFFHNHGLLTIHDRPQWRTVVGGSSTYIEKMKTQWTQVDIRTGADIAGLRRGRRVEIFCGGAEPEEFDEVVIAAHADQALQLLQDPSAEEQSLLGCWNYAKSRTLLHSDEAVMPPLRNVWSSWNFKRLEGAQTCLTYHMNRLQGLETERPYFVSLNLPEDPRHIIREFSYEHPMYIREALKSREKLHALNGTNHTWFAGSYMGNGFHEDAVRSAVNIAEALGMEL